MIILRIIPPQHWTPKTSFIISCCCRLHRRYLHLNTVFSSVETLIYEVFQENDLFGLYYLVAAACLVNFGASGKSGVYLEFEDLTWINGERGEGRGYQTTWIEWLGLWTTRRIIATLILSIITMLLHTTFIDVVNNTYVVTLMLRWENVKFLQVTTSAKLITPTQQFTLPLLFFIPPHQLSTLCYKWSIYQRTGDWINCYKVWVFLWPRLFIP